MVDGINRRGKLEGKKEMGNSFGGGGGGGGGTTDHPLGRPVAHHFCRLFCRKNLNSNSYDNNILRKFRIPHHVSKSSEIASCSIADACTHARNDAYSPSRTLTS